MEQQLLKQQLKNITISLHKIVADQHSFFVKKYSIVKSQFGTNIELHIFKNCSGVSIFGLMRFAKQVIMQFEKDLYKNEYISLQKTILPDTNNIMIYGGKNQAYVGFTSIVYCTDITKAIKKFQSIGYRKVLNCKNVSGNKFV